MITLTQNERDVVDAILNWGGVAIWTDCLQDECPHIAPRSLPGIISSLSRKGVVTCDGRGRDACVTLIDTSLIQ